MSEVTALVTQALPAAMSLVVGFITWSLKKLLKDYEGKIESLKVAFEHSHDKLASSIIDIQKDLSAMHLDTALMKRASEELTRNIDRINAIEKTVILLESKVSALFSIMKGERKPYD